jgi:hypothetical protein
MDFRTVGGSTIKKSFSDTFSRANANTVGPNWIYSQGFANSQTPTTTFSINANQLSVSDTSVNQVQQFAECLLPSFAGAPSLNGVTHFSQLLWVSGNDVAGTRGLQCGPAVAAGLDPAGGFSCYCAGVASEVANQKAVIYKYFSATESTLFTTTALTVPAGTLLRLSYTPLVSSVVLTLHAGSTVIGTVTDSSSPLKQGIPGIGRMLWVSNASPGTGNVRITNFNCGPGV